MQITMTFGAASIALATLLASCASPETGAGSTARVCINPTEISTQTVVSDTEIRFEMRNGDAWVNTLPRRCSGLRLQGGFSWEVTGTLVCSNQQTIYVLDEGTPCQLGEFTKAPAES